MVNTAEMLRLQQRTRAAHEELVRIYERAHRRYRRAGLSRLQAIVAQEQAAPGANAAYTGLCKRLGWKARYSFESVCSGPVDPAVLLHG